METCFFGPLKVIVHPKFHLSSFTHPSSSTVYLHDQTVDGPHWLPL